VRVDVVKGNASEVARIAGEDVKTRGVDATEVSKDPVDIARRLARARGCTVVITGREDVVSDGATTLLVRNGDPIMSRIVGTGCMAASVIGTFAAVERDRVRAAAAGLACYEVAAQLAARAARGPGSFKEALFDAVAGLDGGVADDLQRIAVA
jgi:hydroxyethylthiazole kinase